MLFLRVLSYVVRRALHAFCGGYVRPSHFAEGWSPNQASERIVAGWCENKFPGGDHGLTPIFMDNLETRGVESQKMFPARGCTMSSIHLIKRPS